MIDQSDGPLEFEPDFLQYGDGPRVVGRRDRNDTQEIERFPGMRENGSRGL